MGLFTDSDSAIKVLNKLEEDFGNTGEFLFDGEVLNTGGLVYKKDKDGNLIEYKILSKLNQFYLIHIEIKMKMVKMMIQLKHISKLKIDIKQLYLH